MYRPHASSQGVTSSRPIDLLVWDWNFRVHLDLRELDAAIQFYNDWKSAGLAPHAGVVDDLITDGDGGVHIIDDLCAHPVEPIATGPKARQIEIHVCLTEAELRNMARPKAAAEKSVEDLVREYLASGGTIKRCTAYATTRRDSVAKIVEWVVPKGAPRDVGVCDLAHAMPLNWFQARRRRVWRAARKALRPQEASLIERAVLHGEPTDALPLLKSALRKLREHYEKFDPGEGLRSWEEGVRSNLERIGIPA
jgi:hypothetical protein